MLCGEVKRLNTDRPVGSSLVSSATASAPLGATEIVPVPTLGRTFTVQRSVRLGDVTPKGRLRLDAIARYLQDVANDDAVDGQLPDALSWVVRRTMIEVHQAPVFREPLDVTTFCGGYGSRWAERRTQLVGADGGHVEAVTIWVRFNSETRRPAKLSPEFHEIWGGAAKGRVVRARNFLPAPAGGEQTSRWHTRFVDFDVLAHLNNAVYWNPVEEQIGALGLGGRFRAEVEYGAGITRDQEVMVSLDPVGTDGFDMWLLADGSVQASARVRPLDA